MGRIYFHTIGIMTHYGSKTYLIPGFNLFIFTFSLFKSQKVLSYLRHFFFFDSKWSAQFSRLLVFMLCTYFRCHGIFSNHKSYDTFEIHGFSETCYCIIYAIRQISQKSLPNSNLIYLMSYYKMLEISTLYISIR